MTNFDTTRRETLSADDEAFLELLEGDRGLLTQFGATFRGPLRHWTRLVFVFIFVVAALTFWAAYQAIIAQGLRETVLWSAGAVIGANSIGMLKQWLFDRMNHLAVLRALKKIELRLAH